MHYTNCHPGAKQRRRAAYKSFYKSTIPSANIKREENAFVIEMAIPGFSKADIGIDLKDHYLTIKSNKENNKSNLDYTINEFDYQNFSRSFSIPKKSDIANIAAKHENGVLTITIPDLPIAPAKKIEVK